jgi:hypothetical protein
MKKPMSFTPPSWARKFHKEDFRYRGINSVQYGFWWIEVSFPFNTVTDNQVNKLLP